MTARTKGSGAEESPRDFACARAQQTRARGWGRSRIASHRGPTRIEPLARNPAGPPDARGLRTLSPTGTLAALAAKQAPHHHHRRAFHAARTSVRANERFQCSLRRGRARPHRILARALPARICLRHSRCLAACRDARARETRGVAAVGTTRPDGGVRTCRGQRSHKTKRRACAETSTADRIVRTENMPRARGWRSCDPRRRRSDSGRPAVARCPMFVQVLRRAPR
jgi:hypothetical protein